jgi:hypothetical protein
MTLSIHVIEVLGAVARGAGGLAKSLVGTLPARVVRENTPVRATAITKRFILRVSFGFEDARILVSEITKHE